MLLPIEINLISKKTGRKWNAIWSSCFSNGKVVFTLLREIKTLYIGPTTVNVRGLGLIFILE